MDWVQVLQVFCVPAIGYLFYEISRTRRELWEFKEQAAREYATNDAILRMESKIDGLRDLIIEEFKNETTAKRYKK